MLYFISWTILPQSFMVVVLSGETTFFWEFDSVGWEGLESLKKKVLNSQNEVWWCESS